MREREIDFHIAADTILSPSVELLGRKREFGGIWGGIRCSSWWKVPGEEKLRALGELSCSESCQCCPPHGNVPWPHCCLPHPQQTQPNSAPALGGDLWPGLTCASTRFWRQEERSTPSKICPWLPKWPAVGLTAAPGGSG